MGLALVLILLALAFGGFGLFIDSLKWVLIVATVLLIAGALIGGTRRTTATSLSRVLKNPW